MPSPICIIAISAPKVKKPIPTISMAAPVRNISIVPDGSEVRNTLTMSTIIVIGSTEKNASMIFSFSILFIIWQIDSTKISPKAHKGTKITKREKGIVVRKLSLLLYYKITDKNP